MHLQKLAQKFNCHKFHIFIYKTYKASSFFLNQWKISFSNGNCKFRVSFFNIKKKLHPNSITKLKFTHLNYSNKLFFLHDKPFLSWNVFFSSTVWGKKLILTMSLHDKHQKKAAECLHHSNYQAVTCLDTTTHSSSFIGEGLFKIQGFLQLKSLGRNQMSTFFSYHICFMIASFLICNTMFCPPTTHTVIHTTHSLL